MKTVLDILDEEDRTSAVPTDTETRQIAGWVSKVQLLDRDIKEADERHKSAKAERWHVVTVDLPLAFQALGIERMDVAGLSLTIRPIVAPNPKKEDLPEVHRWLEENGHGDLIKRVVTVPFGRGDTELFDSICTYLGEKRIEYEVKEGVNHNTLQAWARQMVNDGQELPEVLNVWLGQECVLKERK